MNLLSVLSWILFACLALVFCAFLMGKIAQPKLEAQRGGKVSKWGAALRLTTWTMLSIYWVGEVDPLFAKVGIFILGVGIAVAAEINQIKSLRKQNQFVKETQW